MLCYVVFVGETFCGTQPRSFPRETCITLNLYHCVERYQLKQVEKSSFIEGVHSSKADTFLAYFTLALPYVIIGDTIFDPPPRVSFINLMATNALKFLIIFRIAAVIDGNKNCKLAVVVKYKLQVKGLNFCKLANLSLYLSLLRVHTHTHTYGQKMV
jgi:hypothetical protein